MTTIRHLYFHIPFCPKLCPYCSFYVEVGAKNKNREFLDALLREVDRAAEKYALRPETIYFGGGTPTSLLTGQLDYLLTGLRERLDLTALREWTVEANPATVRAEKARLLREMGVTRVSLGVQSWDDALLKTLGRVHSAAQAEKTYDVLRESGIAAVNLDLMFAVPGQRPSQWRATLEKTLALQPDHISSYCLTYEEDTAYFQKLTGGDFKQDDERDAQLFEETMDTLSAGGFAQYEISNYTRSNSESQSGCESQHNRAYWLGADYLGFGPGAFSTVAFSRWENMRDTAGYTRGMLAGADVTGFREQLDADMRTGEIAAFRIRMAEGIPAAELGRWSDAIAEFERHGLVERNAGIVRLTRRGKMLADTVAEAFIEPRA
ncbi:MAG: radical SAM family heme chaperone HemW [Chthoniobacteraceae bacterium]